MVTSPKKTITSQHLHHCVEWLQKIDFRTSLGRRLKTITGLSGKQCKILFKKHKISQWTTPQRETILKFISEEYPYNISYSNNDPPKINILNSQDFDRKAIIQLQKVFRGYLCRLTVYYHGLAYYNRDYCVNDADFYNLEPLSTIPSNYFFSFCQGGKHYGTDVRSFIMLPPPNISNPYNREPLHSTILERSLGLVKKLQATKHSIEYEAPELSETQLKTQRVLTLFQYIDKLDNYTDTSWYWNLDVVSLQRWYIEVEDIWNYRAQLTQEVKHNIIPQTSGKPFPYAPVDIKKVMDRDTLREVVLTEMERLVYSGIDRHHQVLGAMYLLTGLVIVNQSAAEAMPWLWQ